MARLVAGDVVITPAVDRLSRNTTDLLVIARDMQWAGAGIAERSAWSQRGRGFFIMRASYL